MTPAQQIWNRACQLYCTGAGEGDLNLWRLLRVHGAVRNGGVSLAGEVCAKAELEAASRACLYFGLEALSELVFTISKSTAADDVWLQREYDDLVPDDQVLLDAFERRLADTPEEFEPPDVYSR